MIYQPRLFFYLNVLRIESCRYPDGKIRISILNMIYIFRTTTIA